MSLLRELGEARRSPFAVVPEVPAIFAADWQPPIPRKGVAQMNCSDPYGAVAEIATQYDVRVPVEVRDHTAAFMARWRSEGRDDFAIEDIVKSTTIRREDGRVSHRERNQG